MKLQTVVDTNPSPWKIGYEDRILMLGSCFSDEIGEQMAQRYMHVVSNPFGTLYNPLSIANAINYKIINHKFEIINHKFEIINHKFEIINPKFEIINPKSAIPLVEYGGLWHSMAHHGSFSRADKTEAEAAVRDSIEAMQKALADATVVIITFGTAWVYEIKGERFDLNGDRVVANCHKMPEDCFTRRRLSTEEIVAAWQPIIACYPDKHWIFTVSPIRHIKDGLHENQLSKATLLQAVEQLTAEGGLTYFPSYEIMLDELRDYRFYADDLVHPSSMAVQYIWERFADTFCTPQTRNEMNIQHKRWKQTQHKPLH